MTCWDFIINPWTLLGSAFAVQAFLKLACKCRESCECECMDGIITFKKKPT